MQTVSRSLLRVVATALISLSGLAYSDETAVRALKPFSTSNFLFFLELERTNPAMLKANAEKWSVTERDMFVEGYCKIPYLRQFNNLFPTNIDFRDFSRDPAESHLWTWQTGIYGRYLFRMEVLFRLDASWTNIVSYDPPSFFLISYDCEPHSRGFCDGREVSRRTLSSSDWMNLVASGGDLSVIGFKAYTNNPISNFDVEWRRRRW